MKNIVITIDHPKIYVVAEQDVTPLELLQVAKFLVLKAREETDKKQENDTHNR